MTVAYSLAALTGLVHHGGPVQLVTRADPRVALDAFRRAARVAEEPFADIYQEGGDSIGSGAYATMPGGPTTYLTLCDSLELLGSWLAVVSHELERAGISGRLSRPQSVEAPRCDAPHLVAVIALEVDTKSMLAAPHNYGYPDPRWWVTSERTERLVPDLVDWCLDTPGEVFLYAVTGMWLAPEQAAPLVTSAVQSNNRARLMRTMQDMSKPLRSLSLHETGGVVASIYAPGLGINEQIQVLRTPLELAAAFGLHAFVRASAPTIKSAKAWGFPPAAPIIDARNPVGSLSGVIHLLDEFVPDAYGQQVLTTGHLNRIAQQRPLDPSRWDVVGLGGNRHLVTAVDLDPWFGVDTTPYGEDDTIHTRTPVPDSDTLARARADFAPALLTQDVLSAYPPPPSTGPRRIP